MKSGLRVVCGEGAAGSGVRGGRCIGGAMVTAKKGRVFHCKF